MSDIKILIDIGIEKCPPEKNVELIRTLSRWARKHEISVKHHLAVMGFRDVEVNSQAGEYER